MVKFSHHYDKFPKDYCHSELLQVLKGDTRELSNTFIEYDTKTSEGLYYPLADGPIIILLFRTETSRKLWTTIRPYTTQKYNYYKQLEGFILPMVMTTNGPPGRATPSSFVKMSEYDLGKRHTDRYLGHVPPIPADPMATADNKKQQQLTAENQQLGT